MAAPICARRSPRAGKFLASEGSRPGATTRRLVCEVVQGVPVLGQQDRHAGLGVGELAAEGEQFAGCGGIVAGVPRLAGRKGLSPVPPLVAASAVAAGVVPRRSAKP